MKGQTATDILPTGSMGMGGLLACPRFEQKQTGFPHFPNVHVCCDAGYALFVNLKFTCRSPDLHVKKSAQPTLQFSPELARIQKISILLLGVIY